MTGHLHDLVVLGAGATGLAAALGAAQAGRDVLLLDGDAPGGDCTFRGCVPSKTLIEVSRRVHQARHNPGTRAEVEVDVGAVQDHVAAVVTEVARDESPEVLAHEGVTFQRQRARFTGATTVETEDGTTVRAKAFVIATGAGPTRPPLPGLDGVDHLTSDTVWGLRVLPSHLLVLGGGPIACELAQAWRRLGADVTVIEMTPRLLGRDEPAASEVVAATLRAEGVTVMTGARVERVSAGPTLHLADGREVSGSHLLLAVGRTPSTGGLGLDAAGVEREERSGRVVVDDDLRTGVRHIWAAGDCASPLAFTHVGDAQGRLAARNAFARRAKAWDARVVPTVTYTDPEVAQVGMTEAQAFQEWGPRARVTHVAMSGQDRARCAGETSGFVQIVAAPTTLPGRVTKLLDRIVGMTVVAPTAGELVHVGVAMMATEAPAYKLAQAIHAYPSWSMAVRYAAVALFSETDRATVRPAQG